MTLLCAGMIYLLAIPPFLPADESTHASYALTVADGRLPRLEDNVKIEIPGQKPMRVYLANHPPLYYAFAGPVLEWGVDSGHSIAGIRIVRGFSLVLAAGTVVATAALAGLVVRRRRTEAMVLAAGIAATVPTFVSTSVLLHNDLLAVFSAAVAYVGAVAALVNGPRRSYVVLVCLGSAVTMATRLNGAPMVALACAGLGLAVLLHTDGSNVRRVLRAGALAAAPAVAAVAASGWFYLRNVRLYGDVAGVGHNRELGGRTDTYTPLGYLTEWKSIPDLLTRVENGGPWRQIQFFGLYDRKLLAAVVAVIAGGGLLLAWDTFRRSRSGADDRAAVSAGNGADGDSDAAAVDEAAAGAAAAAGERAARLGRLAGIAMVVALPLLLWVQLSGYVSQTGTPNPRYLFPGVPAMAVIVAVLCLGYRRRLGVVVGGVVLSFQVVLGLTTLGRWITRRTGVPPTNPIRQMVDSLEAGGIPAPAVVLAVLSAGAFVGIALQVSAMWTAATRRPGDQPEGAEDAQDAVVTPPAGDVGGPSRLVAI